MDFLNELDSMVEEIAKYKYVHKSPKKPSEQSIMEVEKKLNVVFTTEYREFLRRFGALIVAGSFYSGIYDDNPSLQGSESIVALTELARENQGIPEGLIAISLTDIPDTFLDLRDIEDEQPTCPVVCYSSKSDQTSIFYESFSEYILDYIEGSLKRAKSKKS